MPTSFANRLRSFAEVIVRIGLNLQPGQHLLIAEPYELHGVARSAKIIVEAIKDAAVQEGSTPDMIETIWGDGEKLREFTQKKNWRGLASLVAVNAHKMNDHLQSGGALLFLLGSQPTMMEGIPPKQVSEARAIGGDHFRPVAEQLMQGATNWTAVPAPSADWADAVHPNLPATQRLDALWETVFEALRIPSGSPAQEFSCPNASGKEVLARWETHLRTLQKRRDNLNAQRFKSLRYHGEGTDLTVALPPEHQWCTASLRTKSGIPFVANLPTEEVFTLPHKDSANGTIRVACPITFSGTVVDGINLEFSSGRVVKATAEKGKAILARLLDTDEGASRLGEIALVAERPGFGNSNADIASSARPPRRLFHHVLLDENAGNHIALGDGYDFCLRKPNPAALNRSLIHVDLPITASVELRH